MLERALSRFVSGNAEHPSDRFPEDTVVEVQPESAGQGQGGGPAAGGFVRVGHFDSNGVAEGSLLGQVGGGGGSAGARTRAVRIRVGSSAGDNWVILSEMHLKPADADSQAGAGAGAGADGARSSWIL